MSSCDLKNLINKVYILTSADMFIRSEITICDTIDFKPEYVV
jgi:hypothetical protein